MNFLKFIGISIIFLAGPMGNSQKILWEKSYGGEKAEYLNDIIATADYGFILAGSSASGKSGNKDSDNINDFDYWIWKMDEKGDLDWQKSFGGNGSDKLMSIRNTIDGGFVLAGNSNSSIGGDKLNDSFGQDDFWVIKLNAEGGEEWQKTIGGSGKDALSIIEQTKDGGYIIGGSSESGISGLKTEQNYGSLDYWIVKLSSLGEIEWQKVYGGIFTDKLESLIVTKDEGYLIGGWSNSPKSGNKLENGFGEGDYWILKLNKSGVVQWEICLGGDLDDKLSAMIEVSSGGFLVGGSSRSKISGNKTESNGKGTDFWVLRLSEDGNIEWQKTYDFGQWDILSNIIENEDESFLIGGHSKTETIGLSISDKNGINDYIALKIDKSGVEKWRKTIGSSGEEILTKIIETREGGYLFAGTSLGEPSRDKNSKRGLSDFWVVKLLDAEKKEKERMEGLEAFPNPTQGYTNVIVNHDFEYGKVYMYDLSGKVIQSFKAENKTIPIDLSRLPTGIYIISVESNKTTQSIKIIRGK